MSESSEDSIPLSQFRSNSLNEKISQENNGEIEIHQLIDSSEFTINHIDEQSKLVSMDRGSSGLDHDEVGGTESNNLINVDDKFSLAELHAKMSKMMDMLLFMTENYPTKDDVDRSIDKFIQETKQDHNCLNSKIGALESKVKSNENQIEGIVVNVDEIGKDVSKCNKEFDKCVSELTNSCGANKTELGEKLGTVVVEVKKGIKKLEEQFSAHTHDLICAHKTFESEQAKWRGAFRAQVDEQLRHEVSRHEEEVNNKLGLSHKDLMDIRDNLLKEIEELKGQNSRVEPPQFQSNMGISNDNRESVIKNTNNLAEMYLVDFHGETERFIHPMYYLKFARKFNEVSGNTWEVNKLILLKYLKGHANIWMREIVMTLESYKDFENAFKRRYWGKGIQRQFENELLGKGEFIPGKSDLIEYVMKYYDKNSYLDRPLSMSDFISEIARHLPQSLGLSLTTARDINTKLDLEVLLNQLSSVTQGNTKPVVNNRENNRPFTDSRSKQEPETQVGRAPQVPNQSSNPRYNGSYDKRYNERRNQAGRNIDDQQ